MIRVTLRTGQEIAFEGDTFQVTSCGNLGIFDKGNAPRASVASGQWSHVRKVLLEGCACGR